MSSEIKILKVTKKRKNYIVSTTDKEYSFDEDSIIEFGIFKDKVFSKSDFENMIIKRNENKAFNHALTYLGIGMKSISEIKKYLEKKEYDSKTIENTIIRLTELGYLNDYTYANHIFNYYKENNKGPQFISKKLYEKNISKIIIDQVISEYNDADEMDVVNSIIENIAPRFKEYPIIKQRQLIADKLIRNGFTPNIVYSIIKEYELIDESDNKLLLDLEKQKRLLAGKNLDSYQKKQKIIQSLMNKGYEYHKITEILE